MHSLPPFARPRFRARRAVSALFLSGALLAAASAGAQPFYQINSLVTDNQAALAAEGFGPAAFVDPNLVNPWGVSHSPDGPFWVSNQVTNTATLYNGSGQPFPANDPLVVRIPHTTGPGETGPTGQVFNDTDDFVITNNGTTASSAFIFANLDGSISAWNGSGDPTQAVTVVPAGTTGPAAYTGITIGNSGGDNLLYAANGATGQIDVFDSDFNPTTVAGNFVDPNVPAGLQPFNVQNIDGLIYVTYAIPGEESIDAALGQGAVSVFAPDGTFIRQISSGGMLTSPWGVTLAPDDFGEFSNALLVGNFNNEFGHILAFDPTTGEDLGAMLNPDGTLLTIPALWSLIFGNGGIGGDPDDLYISAGLTDELHGLFAEITPAQAGPGPSPGPVPEPGAMALLMAGLAPLSLALRRRKRT